MKLLIADHIINLDALAWANLTHTWRSERYETVQPRTAGDEPTRKLAYDIHTGVYVRFVDGSNLTLEDTHPDTARLRAALLGTAETTPDATAPGFNPIEAAVLAGLPAELQAAIIGG